MIYLNILPFKHVMNIKILLRYFVFFIPSFQNHMYIFHLSVWNITFQVFSSHMGLASGYCTEWHKFRLNSKTLIL